MPSPTWYQASTPALAVSNDAGVLLWSNYRHALHRVYAAPFSPGVGGLGGSPRLVAVGRDHQQEPSVAAGPDGFFAVWHERAQANASGTFIHGARLGFDGLPQDARAQVVFEFADSLSPQLAFNNGRYLVTWVADDGSGPKLMARPLETSGARLPALDLQTGSLAFFGHELAAIPGSNDFMAVWSESSGGAAAEVWAARINSDAVATNKANLTALSGDQTGPGVACSSNRCLVAWADSRFAGRVYFDLIDFSLGSLLGPTVLSTTASASPIRVSEGAGDFIVTWSQTGSPDIAVFARVRADGTVLDPNGRAVQASGTEQQMPVVAWTGSSFVTAWQQTVDGLLELSKADISIDGDASSVSTSLVKPTGVTSGTSHLYFPSLAFDGETIVLAYRDDRVTDAGIFSVRIAADGGVLDTVPSTVAVDGPGATVNSPSGVNAKGSYVVSFQVEQDPSMIMAVRVPTDGGTPAAPLVLADAGPANPSPVSTALGADVLIAFSAYVGGSGTDVAAVTLLADGGVRASSPNPLVAGPYNQVFLAVASGASQYWLSWSDYSLNAGRYVRAIRMDPALTILGELPVDAASGHGYRSALASNEAVTLLVWDDDFQLRAQLFASDGSAASPSFLIAPNVAAQTEPAVASDRGDFLVVWNEVRDGNDDIVARRVLPDGTMPAPAFDIASSPADEWSPSVTSVGTGRYFVAFSSSDWSPTSTNVNPIIRGRFVAFGSQPLGALCVDAAECVSSFCDTSVGQCAVAPFDAGDFDAGASLLPISVGCESAEASALSVLAAVVAALMIRKRPNR